MEISYDDFEKVEIRVGAIVKAEAFPEARNPSYKVWVDFGGGLGVKQTSAQITKLYDLENLVGKQVMGVLNLGIKRIAGFKSEFLLVGFRNDQGEIAPAVPDQPIPNGHKLH